MSDLDAADIPLARQGNPDAFARIVQRHQLPLARRMRRFAKNPADIEDLVHETFVQAYLSLHTYADRAPFDHWLATLATRVGYALWKRRARAKKLLPLDDAPELPAKPTPDSPEEAATLLHNLLDKLPPRDRLVLTLLHLEERSVAETAAHTGWSQTMVKVQAFRARNKLKKLLQNSHLPETTP